MKVSLVGPSAENITGSLLRPLSIYHALSGLKSINLDYTPVKTIAQIFTLISSITRSDLVIVSGVAPWVAALITLVRRLHGKITILDVHGNSWYESTLMKVGNSAYRLLLFVSEHIAYKCSTIIVVASEGLGRILRRYFKVKEAHVISNPVNPLFTRIIQALNKYDTMVLKRIVARRIRNLTSDLGGKLILVAPLPGVFQANIMGASMLEELIRDEDDVIVVVTGIKRSSRKKSIVYTGYLSYVTYATLLLASDAVILPYPDNAVCGGARNKVLEAAYAMKPVISTRAGMLFINAEPSRDYIPLNEHVIRDIREYLRSKRTAENLYSIIIKDHSMKIFRWKWLRLLRKIASKL